MTVNTTITDADVSSEQPATGVTPANDGEEENDLQRPGTPDETVTDTDTTIVLTAAVLALTREGSERTRSTVTVQPTRAVYRDGRVGV